MAAEKSDMKAHEGTYEGFLTLFKVGTALSFLTGAIVVLLIAS